MHNHTFFRFIPLFFARANPSALILSAFPFLCFVTEEVLDPTGAEKKVIFATAYHWEGYVHSFLQRTDLGCSAAMCFLCLCLSPWGLPDCVCLCVGVREAPGDDILIFVNLGLKATVSQSPLEKGISAQKTDRQRDTRYLLRWLHKLEPPYLFFCVFVLFFFSH